MKAEDTVSTGQSSEVSGTEKRNDAGGCIVFAVMVIVGVSVAISSLFGEENGDIHLSASLRPATANAKAAQDDSGNPVESGETGTHLVVEGRAYYRAKPVSAGIVNLNVVRVAPDPVELSFFVDLEDEGSYSMNLIEFADSDELIVIARVERTPPAPDPGAGSGSQPAKKPAADDEDVELLWGSAEATWNYVPFKAWVRAWGTAGITGAVLLLALLLAILVTGGYSPRKSRLTFMVIYLMAGASLVVPFLALYYAESITDPARMANLPVGILEVGKAGESEVELNQWALNIGGIPSQVSDDGPYDIKNGLVVPLFVLVLATLGGAVNLLRKVPKLQNDINDVFDTPSLRFRWKKPENRVGKFVWRMLEAIGVVEAQSAQSTPAPDAQPEVFEDQAKLNSHRGQLIRQVLFLITAPFLGIVGYYGLMLIEPSLGERTPFIVLFAFSIGLATEGFLDALTQWFDKMLGKLGSRADGQPPTSALATQGGGPETTGTPSAGKIGGGDDPSTDESK